MLRDDQFLNMMSDKPNEDIKKIWQDLCPRHNQVKSLTAAKSNGKLQSGQIGSKRSHNKNSQWSEMTSQHGNH